LFIGRLIDATGSSAHGQRREGNAIGCDFPREHEPCPIGSDRALDNALITAPAARDPELLKKLDAVAGRILRG
jgi:5'-methylthioadenosine phosphorylase